ADGVPAAPGGARANHIDSRRAGDARDACDRGSKSREVAGRQSEEEDGGERVGGAGEERKGEHFAAEPGSAQSAKRAPCMDGPAEVKRGGRETDGGEAERGQSGEIQLRGGPMKCEQPERDQST